MKNFRLAGVMVLSSLALWALPVGVARAEIIDRVVAKVSATVVTQSDVIRFLPIYTQVVGVDPHLMQTQEGRNQLANNTVAYLVDAQLLLAEAAKRDLAVTDDDLNEYLNQQRERMQVTSEQFDELLGRDGIDPADFREFMRWNLTRQRLLQLEVVARVSVTEDEVDQEIKARYPDGLIDTYIDTSHILITLPPAATPEQKAEVLARLTTIRAAILSGESAFADVAAELNPDGSKNTGGHIGVFAVHELDPDYVRTALALDAGEISEPVLTQFGYHLIRLDGREQKAVPDADRIRETIRFELTDREASRQEGIFLERLRDDAFVEIVVHEFDTE